MITFEHVTYTYPASPIPALHDVSLHLPAGKVTLVIGPSGAGKSTLLRCINGLVPHFSGGVLEGTILVGDVNPVIATPNVMSRHVGFIFQDPEAQFVMDRVEDEIAFALENAALPREAMRTRVAEVLELLGLRPLRNRRLETLSGGEKQRVAIAAALALRPRIMVLDEPTSQLDPQSAENVLETLARLNRDLGLTVVVAEHRVERVLPFTDKIVAFTGDAGTEDVAGYREAWLGRRPSPTEKTGRRGRRPSPTGLRVGPPREVLAEVEQVPPVVALGKALGWSPLPLSVREARSIVERGLGRETCAQQPQRGQETSGLGQETCAQQSQRGRETPGLGQETCAQQSQRGRETSGLGRETFAQQSQHGQETCAQQPQRGQETSGLGRETFAQQAQQPMAVRRQRPYIEVKGVDFGYGRQGKDSRVLQGVNVALYPGEILALLGRNGVGKTTLLKSLMGLVRPQRGEITVDGQPTAAMDVVELCRKVGYLPQDPNALLFADTVWDELLITLHNHGLDEKSAPVDPETLLTRLGLADKAGRYPRDLSAGERQRVALGAIMVTRPGALLLDEPTRGLDYAAKGRLLADLRAWRDEGMAIVLVTHDVELVAAAADRVALMRSDGKILTGDPAAILDQSPHFTPQITRLFPGTGWLTVEDALSGLGRTLI
jgi:energy-coupling factor transport system ATP-binding protein